MYSKTLSFKESQKVYVVGDIHGCYGMLMSQLTKIGFDKENDVLIATGDLIDRGYQNLECLKLIYEPWFFTAIGNHEEMLIDALAANNCAFYDPWVTYLKDEEALQVKEAVKYLAKNFPYILEVHHKGKTNVICHADYPSNTYDKDTLYDTDLLIWSRDRVEKFIGGGLPAVQNSIITGADRFIFGHVPLKNYTSIGNLYYIDTGACFGYNLTVIEI